MPERKHQIKPTPFATIERSGSVSVKLDEFLGSAAGKVQLNKMKMVRSVAERQAARNSAVSAVKK